MKNESNLSQNKIITKKFKIFDWPKGIQQWLRVIIALLGIIIGILFYNDINKLATGATLIGFLGYLFDSMFTNMKERKEMYQKNNNIILKNNKENEINNLNNVYIKIIISLFIITVTCILILWTTKGGIYANYYASLGSVLGGLIGGIGTLIAVIITTEETRKIQKENRQLHNENLNTQKLINSLTCIPMLDVNYSKEDKNSVNGKCENLKIQKELYENKESKTTELSITGWILLDNIGKGPCNVKKHRIQYTYFGESKDENVTEWSDTTEDKDVEVTTTEIITKNRNRLYQFSVLDNDVFKGCRVFPIMTLELYYDDLLGNEYLQQFTLFCDENITKIDSVIVDLPKLVRNK